MSNFYNQASWVLVPSGIEEDIVFAQKPISGLGDLQFTRASDATYTDNTGVVRRSPYNLLTFSEMFSNAIWGKVNSSISIDATLAPNGTLTADKLVENTVNDQHRVDQTSTSQAIQNTFSVYAKRAERNFIQLRLGGAGASFDLLNGTFGGVGAGVTASILDAGNGWYRCAITRTTAANEIARINIGTSFTLPSNYAGDGTSGIFIWGAQLVEGTSALDYFPTTNRQDVPRIDFRNADGTLSSCGRLLLEPQRTNSLTRTTDFSSGWTFMQTTLGASSTGPGGANTAFRITNNSSVVDPYFEQSVTPSANTWCWSIYVKQGTASQAWIYPVHVGLGGDTSYARFNFATKTFTNLGIINSSGYQDLGNGLFRIWCTVNITSAVTSLRGRFSNGTTANVYNDWAYPQLEVGAYPTTYIPTTTAAVTRLADAASKTGVSSLIGQQEGVVYWEGILPQASTVGPTGEVGMFNTERQPNIRTALAITHRASTNSLFAYLFIGNGIYTPIITLGISGFASGSFVKIAFAYKSGSSALYINGIQRATSAVTYNSVTTIDQINFNDNVVVYGYTAQQFVNQAALFPTRLTNAQLAQLTTL